MGVFEFENEEEDEEDNQISEVVRLSDNGDGCTVRMTVPSDLDMTPGSHVRVEETEDGFRAKELDI